jgi:hypothetical protein
LAAEIKSKYPKANVELIPSGKGRFEVVHNGKPIFEKSRLDRHARPGEVLGLLASLESLPTT